MKARMVFLLCVAIFLAGLGAGMLGGALVARGMAPWPYTASPGPDFIDTDFWWPAAILMALGVPAAIWWDLRKVSK